jgi:PII-like signaling protein
MNKCSQINANYAKYFNKKYKRSGHLWQDRYKSKPLYEEILYRAKEFGMAGATVLKGVAGMGVHTQIHSFELLSISQNLPLVIEIIDTESKLKEFLATIDEIIEEGLCVIADVEVISYKHK